MLLVGATLIHQQHSGPRKCKYINISTRMCFSTCRGSSYYSLDGVVPLRLLPRVVNVPCVAGHLVSDWHQIPRGTKVSVAMGDMQCSVYAAQPNISDVGTAAHRHTIIATDDLCVHSCSS